MSEQIHQHLRRCGYVQSDQTRYSVPPSMRMRSTLSCKVTKLASSSALMTPLMARSTDFSKISLSLVVIADQTP